jgi:hypothetical protein
VKVKGAPDELTETRLDLGAALPNRTGQLVLMVDPVQPDESGNRRVTVRGYRPTIRAWVQATQIGLDAFADDRDLLAWATSLEDGRPLGDVSVRLRSRRSGREHDGRRPRHDSPDRCGRGRAGGAPGQRRRDPAGGSSWPGARDGSGARSATSCGSMSWTIARCTVREEVQLKGWVRRVGMGRAGDGRGHGPTAGQLHAQGPQGNEVAKGTRGWARWAASISR